MSNKPAEGPEVFFCKTKGTDGLILYSLLSGSERPTQSLMPKSHLISAIMHDNLCQERMLQLEVNQIQRMKIRTFHFHEHMKKMFLNDLRKKSTSWEKEHEAFVKRLQLMKKGKGASSVTLPPTSQQPPLPRKKDTPVTGSPPNGKLDIRQSPQ